MINNRILMVSTSHQAMERHWRWWITFGPRSWTWANHGLYTNGATVGYPGAVRSSTYMACSVWWGGWICSGCLRCLSSRCCILTRWYSHVQICFTSMFESKDRESVSTPIPSNSFEHHKSPDESFYECDVKAVDLHVLHQVKCQRRNLGKFL